MGNYKRPSIVFNLDNHIHKDLYDWCLNQSDNFSDFGRSVLLLYKQSKTSNQIPFHIPLNNTNNLQPTSKQDADAMADLL